MTAYNPPNFNLPIFDSKAFSDVNESDFLEFPTAQGIENFPNGLIGDLNGNATSASTITTNATTQITQHYINFSDSATTGTGAVQKVSGLSVFPNATTYQGNAYTGATLLSNNMVTNNLTSFQANNLILSSNSASGEIRLNLQNNTTRIATISSTGLAMQTGKTISGGLAGGVAGAIVFQSAVGTTGFTNAGTSGQSLLSAGTATPTWGTPAVSTNLAGGDIGRIPYQSAPNTTAFLNAGTTFQVFTSNAGAAPQWSNNCESFIAVNTYTGNRTMTTSDYFKLNLFTVAATATLPASATNFDYIKFSVRGTSGSITKLTINNSSNIAITEVSTIASTTASAALTLMYLASQTAWIVV